MNAFVITGIAVWAFFIAQSLYVQHQEKRRPAQRLSRPKAGAVNRKNGRVAPVRKVVAS